MHEATCPAQPEYSTRRPMRRDVVYQILGIYHSVGTAGSSTLSVLHILGHDTFSWKGEGQKSDEVGREWRKSKEGKV